MSQKQCDIFMENTRNNELKPYIDLLGKKKGSLFFKRMFDLILAVLVLLIVSPVLVLCAIAIKIDSRGPVFYRQERVGRFDLTFRIFKFRTMVADADKMGPQITVQRDPRITRVGRFLRVTRLDEFVQMLNIINGDMSLVGPRPEVRRYVDKYTDEQMATLLIRPGVTGSASVAFKDENDMLDHAQDPEATYINEILPVKMAINLQYLKDLSVWEDIKILANTVLCVFNSKPSSKYKGK